MFMGKGKWVRRILFLILAVLIGLFGTICYSLLYGPELSSIDVSESEKLTSMKSPNNQKVLTIYLRGGMMLYTDYAYVGEIQDLQTKEKHNLFLMPGEDFDVEWLDDNHILLEGKKIKITSTHDFRKEEPLVQ